MSAAPPPPRAASSELAELVTEIEPEIADQMSRHSVPGVGLALVAGGQRYSTGFGVSSPQHPLSVDAHTLFQIGSNSKPLTAAVILALVEQGVLGLDDRVVEHLPGFDLPMAGAAERVTLTDLLTHRLGVDGDVLLTHPPSAPGAPGVLDRLANTAQPLVEPGSIPSYSNVAFSLLALVVESATGRPFARAARELVLRRLRMSRTVATADETMGLRVALPHTSVPGSPAELRRGGGWQPRWELAAHDLAPAGFVSCANDMGRWLELVCGAAPGTPPVSRGSLLTSFEPRAAETPLDAWALGWMVQTRGGRRLLHHPGVTSGYVSAVAVDPDAGVGVAVLTNASGGASVTAPLVDRLLSELDGIEPLDRPALDDPEGAADWVGVYRAGLGESEIRLDSHGELMIEHRPHPSDDGRWQPFPDPPGRLRRWARDHAVVDGEGRTSVDLIRDRHGQPALLRWNHRLRARR